MKKLKILELTHYSAGICGVWQRVRQEALLLSQNHEVRIFSSNITKGSKDLAKGTDLLGSIKMQRFPAKKLGGESFMNWDFEKEALAYKPDIIIAHSYRHPHTHKAIKVAKKIGAKVFLVTHAPFDRSSTRSIVSKIIVKLYDLLKGKKILNSFDKVLAITKWEIPYLLKIGCKKQKIKYLPNGIPKEFFNQKKSKNQNKILFLGRVAPIKDLETLISAIPLIKDKKIKLEIVGPGEENYLKKLRILIKQKKLTKRVIFSKPIYHLKQKIIKIDESKIFVLPSKSEGMPQSLIEAMARERIAIASNNQASMDLITDNKEGYLFEIGNSKQLARRIDIALSKYSGNMGKNAKKSVEKFSWNKVIRELEALF